MESEPIVYIVDDDPDARLALVTLVESMRLKAISFDNAEDFLASFEKSRQSCLLTDLRMRGMNGLQLLRRLQDERVVLPTMIITAYAEIEIVVDSMRAGAVTFLEKTASQHRIVEAISRALRLSKQLLLAKAEADRDLKIWQTFSFDEQNLLELVASGRLNKEIAFELGAPVRTIEDRRRRLMAKVGAGSIVDLVRFAIRVEQAEKASRLDCI